ncbi:hypothetical protein JY651_05530 [Pyxidicoccus parkwayensis]|uniref:Lipoprotein n=1 Tax=Pyxidicoccus parkwayensis TaxID=2813578 RepID=A0ABX7P006_9BACT|nr:hypothetical protein [Pyxidicoccus parkwaysis]QSQ24419.1 hypothetical protein JY651_05530 [Pyxidicoccus parkwaysis]
MRRVSWVFLAVMALAGCRTSGGGSGFGRSGGAVPEGFQALTVPRDDIPIGAIWMDGVGPDGPGQPEANRVRTQSVASLDSNQTLSAGVEGAIAQYLKLTGSGSEKVHINLTSLTIERVKSLADVQLGSGQGLLYEGLRAGKITLTYKSTLEAKVRAAAEEKHLPITASLGGNSENALVLDGSGLFIGYRVVRLVPDGVDRDKERLEAGEVVRLEPYEIELNTGPMIKCYCSTGRDGAAYNRCSQEAPSVASVVNYSRFSGTGGQSYAEKFQVPGAMSGVARVSLGTTVSDEAVSADTLNFRLIYAPMVQDGTQHGLPQICSVFLDDKSYVELVRSRFRIQGVLHPSAPGW